MPDRVERRECHQHGDVSPMHAWQLRGNTGFEANAAPLWSRGNQLCQERPVLDSVV